MSRSSVQETWFHVELDYGKSEPYKFPDIEQPIRKAEQHEKTWCKSSENK